MQRGGIQIDHQGAASESKKESEGRGNKYRVWMVSERPSKRQSRCFLSCFAMPSLRTGLVVTRVQPSSTNKGGRGNDERAERERERKGGPVVPRFYLVSRSAIDRRQATVARSHRALKAKIKLLESGGIRRRPAARSVVPAGRCKRPRSSTSPAFLSLSLFPLLYQDGGWPPSDSIMRNPEIPRRATLVLWARGMRVFRVKVFFFWIITPSNIYITLSLVVRE